METQRAPIKTLAIATFNFLASLINGNESPSCVSEVLTYGFF